MLFLAAAVALHGAAPADTITVAMIDGEPVAAAELRKAFAAERAGTYQYFQQRGLAGGPGFWGTPSDGTSPLAYIRERALNRLVRQKVQQKLMRAHGLWPDITHAAFVERLQAENARREGALAKNEVIYGPKEYSAEGYFEYLFSNALLQLKPRLAGNELKTSEAGLRDFYERAKDRDFNRGPLVEVAQIVVPVDPDRGIPESERRESSRQRIEEARALLAGGTDFAVVAEKFNAARPVRRHYVERDLLIGKLEPDPFAIAAFRLQDGETSAVIERVDGYAILRRLSRAEKNFIPFEECRADVQLRLTDVRYGEYITSLAAGAKVELLRPAWDEVRPE